MLLTLKKIFWKKENLSLSFSLSISLPFNPEGTQRISSSSSN